MTNKEYLETMYKNVDMAIKSIDSMSNKFKNAELKALMEKQKEKYITFLKQFETYAKKKKIKLKKINFITQAMLWTSINMSTLTDKSTDHIAELFLIGTVRGTINLFKRLKQNKNIDEKLKALCIDLLNEEENNFNEIKEYLKR